MNRTSPEIIAQPEASPLDALELVIEARSRTEAIRLAGEHLLWKRGRNDTGGYQPAWYADFLAAVQEGRIPTLWPDEWD